MNETRAEMVEKIRQAQAELRNAGPLHARDLRKHIQRMRREVKTYDRFRSAAGKQPAGN